MTPNYLVIAHRPVASGAQTLLNKQYLAISKGTPLVLRNTVNVYRPAVDSAAPQDGVANLYYWTTGLTKPVKSEHDGKLYPAKTRLLRISMAKKTALTVGATDWDVSSETGWNGYPGARWLALDGDTDKYEYIATLIFTLKQLNFRIRDL